MTGRSISFYRLIFCLFGLGLLTACGSAPTRIGDNPLGEAAYELRFDQLQAADQWSIKGRLAISDGKDGGSGALSWLQNADFTSMSFRGAMGKGAWQLQAGPHEAQIELANGEVHVAASLLELVELRLGWKVPVNALSWWIRGLASPAKLESRSLDSNGQLIELRQSGWEVVFGSYTQVGGISVPSKLTARRGKYLVKMVIKDWKLGAEAG